MREGTIASFSELSALKQRAITLKTQGHTHAAIAKDLQTEFKTKTTKKTIDKWLGPAGALWPAYMSLNEALADAALAEAQEYVKIYAVEAIDTLHELSRPPHTPKIRTQAAKVLGSPLISRIIRSMPTAQPGQAQTASPSLLAEIEREREIIRLGEEALARRDNAIEVPNV